MDDTKYTMLIENLKTSDDKQRAEIINTLSKDYNNAIPLLWSKAVNQENPRAILSVIRDIIKKKKPRGIFIRTVGNSKKKLSAFLQHPDAKVRKNACGIIGEIGDPEYLEELYSAYADEQQLFVRSSYVLAIANCGEASDAEKLEKILEDLIIKEKASQGKDSAKKDEKHINEEKLALTRAIAKLSPPAHHEFKGFINPVPMLLTAMNNQFQVTAVELKEKSIKSTLVDEGILIKEKDLNKVYTCRTFYELLLPLVSCKNLKLDYKEIASAIIKADIVSFLNQCHEGKGTAPFWYRIEFKTLNYNSERSEFVKNLSRELDEISNGGLKNSPSSYEVEIRIVENKKLCSVYIKLYTFKDNRFAYRQQSIPASINPVTAAIVIKSIEKWLKPDAKVIDPFCGTGTMLIERARLIRFEELTGVDIFNDALIAAKTNSELADVAIDLIQGDILEFSTIDVFDEMISNMPFESGTGAGEFDTKLYRDFVNNKIPELIKPGGMAFLYTVEKNLLKQNIIDNKNLQLIDEIKFESGGLTPHLFVIKVK
jgi:23S rRNA G2445 N2-methylase RlmL